MTVLLTPVVLVQSPGVLSKHFLSRPWVAISDTNTGSTWWKAPHYLECGDSSPLWDRATNPEFFDHKAATSRRTPKSMKHRIEIYDTTLRDGTQGEAINFSVADKCRIAEELDALGIDFIEGGWPGSNPRDVAFFAESRTLKLARARIAAFGATRRKSLSCESDPNLQSLLKAETPVVTIFGKSWELHVTDALRMAPEENLEIIQDSVRYLAGRVDLVIYDAEHFFDGYRANPEYAMSTLEAAVAGGAERVVLCDTNGGSLPDDVGFITSLVTERINVPVGIHCHNDGELAVANTLTAVLAGAAHVQGTIN